MNAKAPRPASARGRSKRRPRRSPLKLALYAALVAAPVLGVFLLLRSGAGPSTPAANLPTVAGAPLAQGRPAPDFTATALDGSRLTLSDLRGKPVMVNFFASWCTSCAHELPGIEAEYEKHRTDGFTVVGVNTLENGDGRSFYSQFGLTFPAVLDPGTPGRIGSAYGVTNGLPASVFIDVRGTVQLIQYGEVTPQFIEAQLPKLR